MCETGASPQGRWMLTSVFHTLMVFSKRRQRGAPSTDHGHQNPPCPMSPLSEDSRLQNHIPCRKIPGTSLVRNGPCRLVWSSRSKTRYKSKTPTFWNVQKRKKGVWIRNAHGGRLYERYACFRRPKRSSRVFLYLGARRGGIWVHRHPCTSPPFVSSPVQASPRCQRAGFMGAAWPQY